MTRPSSTTRRSSSNTMLCTILLLLSVTLQHHTVSSRSNNGLGGELAFFETEPFTPDVTHRQDICGRYEQFRAGDIELRYALDGLELRPIMRLNDYFNYNYETGIDEDDPGLMATLMDELADRAGFTWRQSFGLLVPPPATPNKTWTFTDLLIWSVDTYDIAINWWDQSVERMERGVAYIEPWFDGSVILIDQEDPPEESNKLSLFNWLRPFEAGVWYLLVFTVLISGFAHQIIEWLNDDRNDRSMWQWYTDNTYLSWMNITQNYEYAPNSSSGRIFGVSMGIWALIMMATYTANLASLLVEQKVVPLVVDSIDQAIVLDIPICTYGNTNADTIIKRRYESAVRVPKSSELEAYQALRRGECGLVAGYKDNWLGYQEDKRYNPECDLAWVGRTVEIIKSGFATKADAGHLCSSLIRDVLNLHLTELIRDDVLEEAWERHRKAQADSHAIDCTNTDAEDDDEGTFRFLKSDEQQDQHLQSPAQQQQRRSSSSSPQNNRGHYPSYHHPNTRRQLKGASGNSAAATSGQEGERLNVQQMAGVFFLHYGMMGISIMWAAVNRYLRKRKERLRKKTDPLERRAQYGGMPVKDRRVSFRTHGPIIGSAPPINTRVQSQKDLFFAEKAMYNLELSDGTQPEGGSDTERGDRFPGCSDNHHHHHHHHDATYPNEDDPNHVMIRKLHVNVRTSQQEMKDSHTELRGYQMEMARQMNTVMGMLEQLSKQQQQQGNNQTTSGGGGTVGAVGGFDACYYTEEEEDTEKDHRD